MAALRSTLDWAACSELAATPPPPWYLKSTCHFESLTKSWARKKLTLRLDGPRCRVRSAIDPGLGTTLFAEMPAN